MPPFNLYDGRKKMSLEAARGVEGALIPGASLIRTELTFEALEELFAKKVGAIHVSGFYDSTVCARVIKKISIQEEYINAKGIFRIGMSLFESTVSAEAAIRYFSKAPESQRAIEDFFAPDVPPLQSVIEAIRKEWKKGAVTIPRNKEGQSYFAGILRRIRAGSEILPHEDKVERDAKELHKLLDAQLAGNVYLQVPEKGGVLQIWDSSFSTIDYNRLRGESYGIDRKKIPLPSLEITPKQGDLILFNPTNLHAVTIAEGMDRVAQGFFIGLGKDESIKFWS